ncbi:BRO-N domain-containing protein [Methylobacter marinus]|uniref:BRO-N domain-containing protein n=1 Tax=Methylobacter marinus TaxID=34058 RepID=UPI00036452E6|nr:Bro-N domain-containing protein [Methylobacter marinus]
MTALSLSFHNIQFDVIDHAGQPWLRGPQIGDALGYVKGRISIDKIYKSNADEFTDSMTALVELDTNGGKQQVRIFSLRGCHLLAMFARTKVAKKFRKWVLDILDQYTRTQAMEGEMPLSAEVKSAIANRARALNLEHYDHIRGQIVKAVQERGRGLEGEDLIDFINSIGLPNSDLVVIHSADLWHVTTSIPCMEMMMQSGMRAVHELERITGRNWYGR